MGRSNLVGIAIAGAMLVAIAGCSYQESSLDPTSLRTTALAALWSHEEARSKTAPQVPITTSSGADTGFRGALRTSPPQATNPPMSNAVCEQVGQAVSWNDTGKCEPRGLLVSNVYTPMAGIRSATDFGRDPTGDVKSLTNEGGTLLYPLLQVDLSGRCFPILLYVPELHDSSRNPL